MPAVRRLPGPRRVPATTAGAHTAANSGKALQDGVYVVLEPLATDNGISGRTCHRYVLEGIAVPAAQAPTPAPPDDHPERRTVAVNSSL
ncbi:hypothetical protein ACH4ND_05470 [Streptomyces sp. NPDC017179]|uniref:hypothetical protein n=1 Tax=Streptomyces sp. NPDC017179 TaxID=3364979 RepID=UPI003787D0A2